MFDVMGSAVLREKGRGSTETVVSLLFSYHLLSCGRHGPSMHWHMGICKGGYEGMTV